MKNKTLHNKMFFPNRIYFFIAVLVFSLFIFDISALADDYLESNTPLHHIFPQKYRLDFSNRGINVDLYTIPISVEQHRELHRIRFIAGAGKNYVDSWGGFLSITPITAPKKLLFGYAATLLGEANIRGKICFYDYKTRQPTGEVNDINEMKKEGERISTKIALFWSKNKNTIKKIGVGLSAVYLANEVWEIGKAFDDNVNETIPEVKQSIIIMNHLIENTNNITQDENRQKLAQAFTLLGHAYYSKAVKRSTSYYSEIADKIQKKSEKYYEKSEELLGRSISLEPDNPFAHLMLGDISYKNHDWNKAIEEYSMAREGFYGRSQTGWVKKVDELIGKVKKLEGI